MPFYVGSPPAPGRRVCAVALLAGPLCARTAKQHVPFELRLRDWPIRVGVTIGPRLAVPTASNISSPLTDIDATMFRDRSRLVARHRSWHDRHRPARSRWRCLHHDWLQRDSRDRRGDRAGRRGCSMPRPRKQRATSCARAGVAAESPIGTARSTPARTTAGYRDRRRTGKQVWSVMTLDPEGRPLSPVRRERSTARSPSALAARDIASVRGYVTAYDAETGKQLWRFYTVPAIRRRASKTTPWRWPRRPGPATGGNKAVAAPCGTPSPMIPSRRIFIGTGNGSSVEPQDPQRRARATTCSFARSSRSMPRPASTSGTTRSSPARAGTTTRRWTCRWPTLMIDGKPRKVVMQAPKNGFFYVIDRTTGKLISAEPFAKVNWASKIDTTTGRPVECPNIRYESGPITFVAGCTRCAQLAALFVQPEDRAHLHAGLSTCRSRTTIAASTSSTGSARRATRMTLA